MRIDGRYIIILRMTEIARSRVSSEPLVESLLKRIYLISIDTTQQLTDELKLLDVRIAQYNVGLVVVDSIAAVVRKEFGAEEIPQRQQYLSQQANRLK